MLLTFSRHQMMYNVFCVVPYAEVHIKGTFSYSNKEKKLSTRSLITSSIIMVL